MPRSPHPSDFAADLDPFILFQISLENFFEIRKVFAKDHNITFSELDKLPYYEFQILLDSINKDIEEENTRKLEKSTGMVEVFNLSPDKPLNI